MGKRRYAVDLMAVEGDTLKLLRAGRESGQEVLYGAVEVGFVFEIVGRRGGEE